MQRIDEVAARSHVHRSQAFDDTLHLIVCTLGRPYMEGEYLDTVKRYCDGEKGNRAIDTIVRFFGDLINAMSTCDEDLLGDMFEAGISHGAAGQVFTPTPLCKLIARITLPSESTNLDGRRTVADPCCGSGRMLLAAAELQPHWHFFGQDIDLTCVRMTAINLALRNRYGHVIWGNTLANEQRLVYETGRVQVWGNAIRKVRLERAPPIVQQVAKQNSQQATDVREGKSQLHLFDEVS